MDQDKASRPSHRRELTKISNKKCKKTKIKTNFSPKLYKMALSRGFFSSQILIIFITILISKIPQISSISLFPTNNSTLIFNSLSDYTTTPESNSKVVNLESNGLYVAGQKRVSQVYVSPLGAIGLYAPLEANNMAGLKASSQTENLIIAGLYKPAANSDTSQTFSVSYRYIHDSETQQLLDFESSVIGIAANTFFEAHLFTFKHSSDHEFQIILASNAAEDKSYFLININFCQSCANIPAENLVTGIYSYGVTGSDMSECLNRLDSLDQDVQYLDVSDNFECTSTFSAICDDSGSNSKVSGTPAGSIYTGFFRSSDTTQTNLLHSNYEVQHKCDIENRYGDASATDGLETLSCNYDANTYTSAWDSENTVCSIVFCENPVAPTNAIISGTLPVYNTVGAVATYQCPQYTEFFDANQPNRATAPTTVEITCETDSNGALTYSSTTEVCNQLQCVPPATPNLAEVLQSPVAGEHTFGKAIIYRCPNNFKFEQNGVASTQQQLTTICIEDSNGDLNYRTLETTGCLADTSGVIQLPTKDIVSNIEAAFTIDIACNPNEASGLTTTFSNNFAPLILALQDNANSNFQDYSVDSVVCDETTSKYTVTVKFNDVRDASETVGYNEKSDLANAYLNSFTSYIKEQDLETKLAVASGGTRTVFNVESVKVSDSSDPTAPTTEISAAVIQAKAEFQNVFTAAIPDVDPATGETSMSFTNAMETMSNTIKAQFTNIAAQQLTGDEGSVEEKQAELDVANNMMETMTNVFDDWTKLTPELNSTTTAMDHAKEVANVVVALLAKNQVSAAEASQDPSSQALTARSDVANNFLQSMNDMMSYLVQSADDGLDSGNDFSPSNAVAGASALIDMKINVLTTITTQNEQFGATPARKKRALPNNAFLNAGDQLIYDAIQLSNRNNNGTGPVARTTDVILAVNIPENAINNAKNAGLCGTEPFYKQRVNSSTTAQQTNYLNVDRTGTSTRGLIGRRKRDTTAITGNVEARVTVQNLYTDQCYFTIPTDETQVLEAPCIFGFL